MTSATEDSDGREALLEAAVARARERWPGISCSAAELTEHIRGLDQPVGDVQRFGDELCLVCACCRLDVAALRALDREYIGPASSALGRFRVSPDFIDEATQQLRHRLLLPPQPRLAQYAATGPLSSWMRVAMLRLGLDMQRGVRPRSDEELAEQLVAQAPGDTIDVERYRNAIDDAVQAAFQRLKPEDRNLLRLHYLDGVTLDRLAALNGVHRATIARHLADLRDRILKAVEQEAAKGHGLTKSEFRSIFRRVQSGLGIVVGALVRLPNDASDQTTSELDKQRGKGSG